MVTPRRFPRGWVLVPLALLAVGLVVLLAGRRPEPLPAAGPPPGPPVGVQVGPQLSDPDRPASVARRLQEVRVGMLRPEVEAVLGPPDRDGTGAAVRSGGQLVYRTRYPVFVADPLPFAAEFRGLGEAVLEYDAARAGHPLLRVWCEPSRTPGPATIGTA